MIESLKPYSHYRDINEPWLGVVPNHWTSVKIKHLLAERNERGYPAEPLLAATQTKGVVLKADYGTRTVEAMKDLHLLKLVQVGDFVISLRSFQGGIEFARKRGIISPAYTVLYPRISDYHGYLAELFKSRPFIGNLTLYVTGIRQGQNIDYTKLARSHVPLPPPDEQAAIVRVLTAVDRKVNRFIRAKRRLSEVLTEQKQAIITQAVTRGLNPDAPMKPSGIDWLGDVPGHWDVVRFKNRVSFQEGPGIMAADFRDSGVPLLRISCVNTPWSTLAGCNYLDPNKVAIKWSHFAVRAGDYLLTSSGSTGVVSRATSEVVGAIPYTGIIRLWPAAAHRTEVNMEFIRYFIGSLVFQSQISAAKSGVGIEHFGPTHLKRMWLSLPPVSEQRELVRHIESGCSAIDATLESAGREIALIREYRTRLVADVVTGKIDVRSVALPDDDENTLLSSFDSTLDDESLAEGDSEESDAEFSTLAAEDEA